MNLLPYQWLLNRGGVPAIGLLAASWMSGCGSEAPTSVYTGPSPSSGAPSRRDGDSPEVRANEILVRLRNLSLSTSMRWSALELVRSLPETLSLLEKLEKHIPELQALSAEYNELILSQRFGVTRSPASAAYLDVGADFEDILSYLRTGKTRWQAVAWRQLSPGDRARRGKIAQEIGVLINFAPLLDASAEEVDPKLKIQWLKQGLDKLGKIARALGSDPRFARNCRQIILSDRFSVDYGKNGIAFIDVRASEEEILHYLLQSVPPSERRERRSFDLRLKLVSERLKLGVQMDYQRVPSGNRAEVVRKLQWAAEKLEGKLDGVESIRISDFFLATPQGKRARVTLHFQASALDYYHYLLNGMTADDFLISHEYEKRLQKLSLKVGMPVKARLEQIPREFWELALENLESISERVKDRGGRFRAIYLSSETTPLPEAGKDVSLSYRLTAREMESILVGH